MISIEKRSAQSENILRSSFKLFKENGYKKTTTREISEAAQINKGLLHYYYKKKEEIVFEMYSDFISGINDFIDRDDRCKGDAFLYYAVFNILFFRTISSRDYLMDTLAEIVQYRNLTRLKIEKSTEMLYEFLKDLSLDFTEYHLLLAITVAVGAEAELLLSVKDGRIKMTYDKVATTINKLLFTMIKINDSTISHINQEALTIVDDINIEEVLNHIVVCSKWLQD